MENRQYCIKFGEDQAEKIQKEATAQRTSFSAVVRWAVDSFFSKNTNAISRKRSSRHLVEETERD